MMDFLLEKAKNLFRLGESLSQKVVRGGFWVFALRIIQQLFNLIRLIILARILAPHDFGLVGIALLTMAILETFSQTGFQAALVQKKDNTETYLDATWTVLIIRGFILFTILYFIAPYAAIFFKAPEAKLIIQVVGLSILLQAFTNIGGIYFQKELEFDKYFVYQLSGTLADFIVAILVALILRNVWALVFGLLAGNFVRFIVSYFIHPYRPRLNFNIEKAKELWSFGRWVLGSSMLIFLIEHGDDILLGKVLGATTLGLYQMAYRISNLPATEILGSIEQVIFPAYSKLQDISDRLQEAYLLTLRATAFIAVPLAGGIFLLAPDFTQIFLGKQWVPIIPTIQVLCLFVILRCFSWTTGPLFEAIGKPDIVTKLASVQIAIFAIILYPFTRKWGMIGTATAVVIPMLITQILGGFKVVLLLRLPVVKFLKAFFLPLGTVILTIAILMVVKSYLPVNIATFVFTGLIGGVIYLSSIYLFGNLLNYSVKEIVQYMSRAI